MRKLLELLLPLAVAASGCGKKDKGTNEAAPRIATQDDADAHYTCDENELRENLDNLDFTLLLQMNSDGAVLVRAIARCTRYSTVKTFPEDFGVKFDGVAVSATGWANFPGKKDTDDPRDATREIEITLDKTYAMELQMPWAEITSAPESLSVGVPGKFEVKTSGEPTADDLETNFKIALQQYASDKPDPGQFFKNIRRHNAWTQFSHSDATVYAKTNNKFEVGFDATAWPAVLGTISLEKKRKIKLTYTGRRFNIPVREKEP